MALILAWSSDLRLPATKAEAAHTALRAAFEQAPEKFGWSLQGDIQEILVQPNLHLMLEHMQFHVDTAIDSDDIRDLYFTPSDWDDDQDDGYIFAVLAPFIDDGGWIQVTIDEDSVQSWRYHFLRGEVHHDSIDSTYPCHVQPDPDPQQTFLQLIEDDLGAYKETLTERIATLYENEEDDPPTALTPDEQLSYLHLLFKHERSIADDDYSDGDLDLCIKHERQGSRLEAYAQVAEKLFGITQVKKLPTPV